ncbi:hypothetical protein KHQ81_15405 (plasmid) [Mycoplasmatota bacterium]|nr:hypothetical protein KHQ81_15405 [Mycoplasmatota bacterium]
MDSKDKKYDHPISLRLNDHTDKELIKYLEENGKKKGILKLFQFYQMKNNETSNILQKVEEVLKAKINLEGVEINSHNDNFDYAELIDKRLEEFLNNFEKQIDIGISRTISTIVNNMLETKMNKLIDEVNSTIITLFKDYATLSTPNSPSEDFKSRRDEFVGSQELDGMINDFIK